VFDDQAKELQPGVQARSGAVARDLTEIFGRSCPRTRCARNQLYKWKEQLSQRGVRAFPGSGRGSGGNDELARLRKELEKVKEERDILKKAAAYFAKELK
jgi:transposase-like protein